MRMPSLLKRIASATALAAWRRCWSCRQRRQPRREWRQGLPAYMQPIDGRTTSSPAEVATKNMLALNTGDVRALRRRRQDLPEEHPEQASGHPRPVLGRRRTLHPLPARHAAARGAAGADRLSAAEIGRAQHDGAEPGGRALHRQSRQPVLACADARLSQPHAVGARRPRRDADAGGMARQQSHHPAATTSRSWTTAWRRASISFATLEEFAKKQAPHPQARTSPGRRRPRSRTGWT